MTAEDKRHAWFQDLYCTQTGCTVASMQLCNGFYYNDHAAQAWHWFNLTLDAVATKLPAQSEPTTYNSPANSYNDAIRKIIKVLS